MCPVSVVMLSLPWVCYSSSFSRHTASPFRSAPPSVDPPQKARMPFAFSVPALPVTPAFTFLRPRVCHPVALSSFHQTPDPRRLRCYQCPTSLGSLRSLPFPISFQVKPTAVCVRPTFLLTSAAATSAPYSDHRRVPSESPQGYRRGVSLSSGASHTTHPHRSRRRYAGVLPTHTSDPPPPLPPSPCALPIPVIPFVASDGVSFAETFSAELP